MVLGPLEFNAPMWLLLAPIMWALMWFIARKSLSGLGSMTRRLALAIRFVVIGVLTLALAEPHWRDESKAVSVLFIEDVSKSMPPGSQEQALRYLSESSPWSEAGDLIGLTTAAEDGRVRFLPSIDARNPSALQTESQMIDLSDGDRDGTNLAAATKLTLAVAPQNTAARIVLFSDGNETAGSLLTAAEDARARGIPIDVLPSPYSIEREIIFDALVSPPTARKGQNIDLRFVITATRDTEADLRLFSNSQPIDLAPGDPAMSARVSLDRGQNVIPVPIAVTSGGPQRFQAVLEPIDRRDDTIIENNTALAVTFVSSEGKILVYRNDELAVEPFITALNQSRIDVESRFPSQGHQSLVDLQPYDAIVLFDVPSYDFSGKQLDELRAYVHDTGGGLIMVGGPASFGAGGWIGTSVADVLPVKLDPPQKRNIPRGALVLIMHSVEMPQGTFWGKQVGHAAANSLSRLDLIGVLEFIGWGAPGNGAGWAYPLSERGDGIAVNQAIDRLGFGDMPDFDATMSMAHATLAAAKASQKHTIVISDGDPSGPSPALLQKFIRDKISISTVGMSMHGIASDLAKMQRIAAATGGNYYQVNSAKQMATLPEIFIKEAQTVKRALIWEGDPYSPTITNSGAQAMRSIRSLPPITGYVVTADRGGLSTITARGLNDDPIVAQWQHGLGRAVAVTADSTSRWSSSWLNWGQFRAFWDQHARWAMRPSGSANVKVLTIDRGSDVGVIISALTADGDPLNFARFVGRVILPDLTSTEVRLSQTGPGRYEGSFDTQQAGSYLLNVRYESAASPDGAEADRGTVQAAFTRPYADEHRALTDNLGLLQQVADITGGQMLSWDAEQDQIFRRDGLKMPVALTPIWAVMTILALSLFLVDVAVRRVRFDLHAILASVRKSAQRAEEASERQIDALRAARASTRDRIASQREPDSSKAKFEADESYMKHDGTIPLESASSESGAPIVDSRSKSKSEESVSSNDEEGLSRLMQAKRRARRSMDEEEESS